MFNTLPSHSIPSGPPDGAKGLAASGSGVSQASSSGEAVRAVTPATPLSAADAANWAAGLNRVQELFSTFPNVNEFPINDFVFIRRPSRTGLEAGVQVMEMKPQGVPAAAFFPLEANGSIDKITYHTKGLHLLTGAQMSRAKEILEATQMITPQWISMRRQLESPVLSPNLGAPMVNGAPVGWVGMRTVSDESTDLQRFVNHFTHYSQMLSRINSSTIERAGGVGAFKRSGVNGETWRWEKGPGAMEFPVNCHLRSASEISAAATLNGIPLNSTSKSLRDQFAVYLNATQTNLSATVTFYEAPEKKGQ